MYYDIEESKVKRSIKVADGQGNWDLLYVPYLAYPGGEFLSVAKVEGCRTSIFGDLNYVRDYLRKDQSNYMITLQGEEILQKSSL